MTIPNSFVPMKMLLIFVILINVVNGLSQIDNSEDTITYREYEPLKLNNDSLSKLFQGKWTSKDTELSIIRVKDSIWTIKIREDQHDYKVQFNRTLDNYNRTHINITLLQLGKSWSDFKDGTKDNEILLFTLESISNSELKIKDVFGDEFSFAREYSGAPINIDGQ